MLEITGLNKRYGSKYAVNDVSFTIKKGEIVGFLGRNGAGKTTTMNIITGYISPSSGDVKLDGHSIMEDPRYVKRRIGYLPEQPPLYMDMTVNEFLKFACAIKGVVKTKESAHIADIVDLVKLDEVKGRLIKNLSKGFKQRVGLAQALIGNPEMIILDEPTVGLDPKQIIEIRSLIKRLGKDHTVVLSSHILSEVADVCERVIIINQGRIVAQDKLENLTKGIGESSRLIVRVAGSRNDVKQSLRTLDGATYVEALGEKEDGSCDFVVEAAGGADLRRQMFSVLSRNGMPILMLKPSDATLEDIFLKLTSDGEGA